MIATRWEVKANGISRVTMGKHSHPRQAFEEMLGTGLVPLAYRNAEARRINESVWVTLAFACQDQVRRARRMGHEHTEECMTGCTHLAAMNKMLADMVDYKEQSNAKG